MKPVGMISAAALLFLLGAVAPAHAIQEPHEQEAKPEKQAEAKPPKQEQAPKQEKQPEAKPAKQEPQAKPEKQQEPKAEKQAPEAKPEKQQATKPAPEAKPEKQQQAKTAKPTPQPKAAKQEQAKAAKPGKEAKPEKQEQAKARTEPQAKPGNGQRPERTAAQEQRQRSVPALRLSERGTGRIPDERFHANFGESHTFVINEPVMVGGYSRFQYGGFWFGFVQPWPDGWYYTDNVYVDFIGGEYVLINPYYPGVQVGISVVL
jgi:hypothetical protein